jgi:cobalamin biosynthesis protein CobT
VEAPEVATTQQSTHSSTPAFTHRLRSTATLKRHEDTSIARINMTESSPQPGDNDTHDKTIEPKSSHESIPDHGTGAVGTEGSARVRASSGASAETGDGTGASGAQSSGDEDESDEEEGDNDGDDNDDEDDEDEEDDDEPKLKYARLTQHLGPVYRNGDATSAFLVAGDKMIVGTHNGNIVSLASLFLCRMSC